jgi:lactoylglutathione lyase
MHLYETHLPVANTEASRKFYEDVVGLKFGYRDPGRDIVFLFIGEGKRSMLGLWGPGTNYGREPHRCHFAIAISLAELLEPASDSMSSASQPATLVARRQPSRR